MPKSDDDTVRVLQVVPFNKRGGLPLRTYRVSKYLNNNSRIENVVVVPETTGEFYQTVQADDDVEIHKLDFSTPKYFDSLSALSENLLWAVNFVHDTILFAKFVREHDIDVVHVNEIFLLQAAIGARIGSATVAWHLISDQFPPWLVKTLMPVVNSLSEVRMVVTESNLEYYIGEEVEMDSIDDVMVVPGVADTENLNPETVDEVRRNSLREEFDIKDELVITTVANLNPTKGIEYALEALADIPGEFTYLVVGEADNSEYMLELDESVCRLNLENDVCFTGYREDVEGILSISDIFVLPSTGEGTPLTIMEAMKMGVPIVATDVGGIQEMLKNGEAGQIVPPRSDTELCRAIRTLMENPELRTGAAANGQKIAREQFSTQKLTDRYKQAYEYAAGDMGDDS